MLSEAKDTSELMVDLGYASLFFGDTRMADEVTELEEVLTELVHLGGHPRLAEVQRRVPEVDHELGGVLRLREHGLESSGLVVGSHRVPGVTGPDRILPTSHAPVWA